jgi:hypothetical protein
MFPLSYAEWRGCVAIYGGLIPWRESLAQRVRIAQQIAGIPRRTIQEAIEAGEYA